MKNKSDTLLGNGFVWVSISVISVITPTVLAYLFERISQEEVPDIGKYFDSILLIVFSISCSLFAICLDNRSKSINNKFREVILILSFIMASGFGAYHFYIIGKDNFIVHNIVLIITICIMLLFSVFGFIISHHHNLYDDNIKEFCAKIIQAKKQKKINTDNQKALKKNRKK